MIKRKCKKCGREWKCEPIRTREGVLCSTKCEPLCFKCFIEKEGLNNLSDFDIKKLLEANCWKYESDEYKMMVLI